MLSKHLTVQREVEKKNANGDLRKYKLGHVYYVDKTGMKYFHTEEIMPTCDCEGSLEDIDTVILEHSPLPCRNCITRQFALLIDTLKASKSRNVFTFITRDLKKVFSGNPITEQQTETVYASWLKNAIESLFCKT